VNVLLSQVKLESFPGCDIPGGLGDLNDARVELDDVANVESDRRWAEHEENVAVAPSIAVRQRPIEFLDGCTHMMTPNITLEITGPL
jgi:hypothetical protein